MIARPVRPAGPSSGYHQQGVIESGTGGYPLSLQADFLGRVMDGEVGQLRERVEELEQRISDKESRREEMEALIASLERALDYLDSLGPLGNMGFREGLMPEASSLRITIESRYFKIEDRLNYRIEERDDLVMRVEFMREDLTELQSDLGEAESEAELDDAVFGPDRPLI